MEKKTKLPEGAKEFFLYNNEVHLVFNPNSPRYRYRVTDRSRGVVDKPVRGVTTLLRDVINKPDLMAWPMNMSHQKLFGAKFDEVLLEYVYDKKKALIKPETEYTALELQEFMVAGRKAHRDRSDRGKDVGTMVHKAIEMYLKGKSYDESVEAGIEEAEGDSVSEQDTKALRKALTAFTDWWDNLPSKEVISTERPVYSRMMSYAGTGDLIAEIDGKVYMLDIKTTNSSKKAPLGIYAENFMQLGAYAHATREENGTEFDDLGIIRVSKEGQLSIATATDMGTSVPDCERAFAFAVRVHDWLEGTSKYLSDAHFKSHLIRLVEGREPESESN